MLCDVCVVKSGTELQAGVTAGGREGSSLPVQLGRICTPLQEFFFIDILSRNCKF